MSLPEHLAPHRKVSVKQAAELINVSEDTFRRRFKSLIKQISERRQAVDLAAVLAIGTKQTAE
jgi:DeoR/GlpR family transcriptional regulator of sugar metabolism